MPTELKRETLPLVLGSLSVAMTAEPLD